jgi:hypothetical protein
MNSSTRVLLLIREWSALNTEVTSKSHVHSFNNPSICIFKLHQNTQNSPQTFQDLKVSSKPQQIKNLSSSSTLETVSKSTTKSREMTNYLQITHSNRSLAALICVNCQKLPSAFRTLSDRLSNKTCAITSPLKTMTTSPDNQTTHQNHN